MKYIVPLFNLNDCEKYSKKADTILCGMKNCSVRCVRDYTQAELSEIAQLCQKYDLEMAVAVNRFFLEEDLPLLKEALAFLKGLNVSRIYYSDESVLWCAMQLELHDRLVYAPETLVTNHQDASYYIQEGIKGVVLSKDITLKELCSIASHCPNQCEVIIHGRVNIMHSRRYLLTSYMDFIKKDVPVRNRHDLYLVEEKREDKMPIIEDEMGTHVFSGYTLASFNELQALKDASVEYVRIEGLFHDVDYVLEALDLYHQVMNGAHPQAIMDAYQAKYADDHVTDGFYHQATSKIKEC